MKNRIGKVKVTKQLVESFCGIFKLINPIRIEQEEHGVFIYTCLSDHFSEVEEGEIIPFYTVCFSSEDDKILECFISRDQDG